MTLLERADRWLNDPSMTTTWPLGPHAPQPSRVLLTKHLLLRPFISSDAETVATLVNEARGVENIMGVAASYSVANAQQFIASLGHGGEWTFAITLLDGGLIGLCSIALGEHGPPELGYGLAVPYRQRGYTTEAVAALLEHAFDALGVESLCAKARVNNPASRRVLDRCSFQHTGIALYRVVDVANAVPFDCFRLDRDIWEATSHRRRMAN